MQDTVAPIQRYSRVDENTAPLQRTALALRPRGDDAGLAMFAPRLGNAR